MYQGDNVIQNLCSGRPCHAGRRSWRSEPTQTLKPHTTDKLCVAPLVKVLWMKVIVRLVVMLQSKLKASNMGAWRN